MRGDGAAAKALSKEELGIVPDEETIANLDYDEATQSPIIKHTAGLMRFWWPAEQIEARITRTHQHKDGRVTAEVKFQSGASGFPRQLHQCQINLVATRSKQELANALHKRREDIPTEDWQSLVEEMSWEVIDRLREGEPVIEITTEDDVPPLSYLVDPIVVEDEPTVIYGLGGCGKSTIALLLGLMVQMPLTDNKLGLTIKDRKGVLYLDWETSHQAITRRMKALQKGLQIPTFMALHYRRCSTPLADDTEAVQRAILDNNIGFVIIDSVAAACGGDLNAAEPALRMFKALRELKVTSLLVAHTSKNSATKETSIYGSAFFTNYGRSVWEMKKKQQVGVKGLKVGLYHRKANDSELFKPLGFEIKWDRAKSFCCIEAIDIGSVAELATEGSMRDQVLKLLSYGQMTTRAIAEALEADEVTVRARLNDLEKAGRIHRFGTERTRSWGLAAHADD